MTHIHYYCTPRQYGKTTRAIEMAKVDENCVILSSYPTAVLHMAKEIGRNRVASIGSDLIGLIHGRSRLGKMQYGISNVIILDEYHFATRKEKSNFMEFLLKYANSYHIKDIYVFTTPRFQISEDLYNFISFQKSTGESLEDSLDKWKEIDANNEGVEFFYEAWEDILFIDSIDPDQFTVNFYDAGANFETTVPPKSDDQYKFLSIPELTGAYIVSNREMHNMRMKAYEDLSVWLQKEFDKITEHFNQLRFNLNSSSQNLQYLSSKISEIKNYTSSGLNRIQYRLEELAEDLKQKREH